MRSVTFANIAPALSLTTASVITTESIVANAGASIPAPLAIPATCTLPKVACAIFGTESVVIIACAHSCNESVFNKGAIFSSPATIFSIGSNSPMRPVEQTTTSPEETLSSSPTFSAVLCVSAKP